MASFFLCSIFFFSLPSHFLAYSLLFYLTSCLLLNAPTFDFVFGFGVCVLLSFINRFLSAFLHVFIIISCYLSSSSNFFLICLLFLFFLALNLVYVIQLSLFHLFCVSLFPPLSPSFPPLLIKSLVSFLALFMYIFVLDSLLQSLPLSLFHSLARFLPLRDVLRSSEAAFHSLLFFSFFPHCSGSSNPGPYPFFNYPQIFFLFIMFLDHRLLLLILPFFLLSSLLRPALRPAHSRFSRPSSRLQA